MRNLFPSPSRSRNRRTRATRARQISMERLEERSLLTAVAPPSGLISWWTADGTAADLRALNDASMFNGASFAAGKVGQAFQFDGVNDRAQVADAGSLQLTGSLTIEGWLRVDSVSPIASGQILFRGDDRGGLDPYALYIDPSGTVRFLVTPITNQGVSIGAPAIVGQWSHVAATLDDATGAMKLYVNGALAAQTITTARPFGNLEPASNPSIGIGNHGGYPTSPHNFPFDGLIDELSVYNRALTSGEVQGIYSAGSAGKIKTSAYIAADFQAVMEGAVGTTTPVTFTIRREGNLGGQAVVDWITVDGTANAGIDYQAATGTVVFQPGEGQKSVTVNLIGDGVAESAETFQLELSTTAPGYAVGMGQATIADDDIGVSVSGSSVIEGDTMNRPLGALVPANFAGLANPYAMIIGPDGDLYVSDKEDAAVLRYDPVTGAPRPAPGKAGAQFVSAGSGGLQSARDLAFAPDGTLCVVSEGTDAVLRYDPTTGAYLGALVAPGAGGLDAPRGLTFRGGYAYVTSVGAETAAPGKDSVLRFNATTGAPAGVSGRPGDAVFIASGSGGVDNPSRIVFGPDGRAYVSSTAPATSSAASNSVLRYNGTTGAPAGVSGKAGDAGFVSSGSGGLDGPIALVFRPDGFLYVTGARSHSVLRYQAATGAPAGTLVEAGSGGLNNPVDLLFEANGNVLVTSKATNEVLRFGPGSQVVFTVRLSFPSDSPVTVSYTTSDGTATAGSDYTAATGTLTFAPGQTSRTILVSGQTANDGIDEGPETFSFTLSDAVGATITGGPGVGTIREYIATKFYVIDDGNVDRTYEYGAAGSAVENYGLNQGTAPRGAASNAAGTTIWVVDANKYVSVFDTAGGLVGHWLLVQSPGGLSTSAQLEGIATNGSDLWVLDNYSDKVFKFTGAASLRFGVNQSANSSFKLAKGNTNPRDIVTDGTSFWVVDDAATDKVFKYSLTGSLLGSWTIAGAGASPTGITLDPAGGGSLWLVDSGSDLVYRFDNARGRTSGTQSPSTSFALADGNTNPQGIADPPSGDPMPVEAETLCPRVRNRLRVAAARARLWALVTDNRRLT